MTDAIYKDTEPLITLDEQQRLDAFLTRLRERGRSPKTALGYADDHQALARWFVGTNNRPFDLKELSGIDCADFLSYLQRTNKPATVARRLIFLRAYAIEAYKRGAITAEMFERIDALRPPRTQNLAPRGITADEARQALREVDLRGSPRDRAIIYVFLSTGIRVGELAGCERRDVEITERQGSIHIRPEVSKGGRDRTVPLAKEARNFLLAYLSSRVDDDPALFVGQRGPLTAQGIRDLVVTYVGVSPHRLRHAFAYEYLRANKNDLVALADLLGHESLNTTRHYTRRRKEDLEDGVERVRYDARKDEKGEG